jgi:hypothetical protein
MSLAASYDQKNNNNNNNNIGAGVGGQAPPMRPRKPPRLIQFAQGTLTKQANYSIGEFKSYSLMDALFYIHSHREELIQCLTPHEGRVRHRIYIKGYLYPISYPKIAKKDIPLSFF